jgi:hypothetical protein
MNYQTVIISGFPVHWEGKITERNLHQCRKIGNGMATKMERHRQ